MGPYHADNKDPDKLVHLQSDQGIFCLPIYSSVSTESVNRQQKS